MYVKSNTSNLIYKVDYVNEHWGWFRAETPEGKFKTFDIPNPTNSTFTVLRKISDGKYLIV